MDLLSSRLTRLYHGLVRAFFAVCAVWLFVSCLVCTNFLDLEERSHLTADNVLSGRFMTETENYTSDQILLRENL